MPKVKVPILQPVLLSRGDKAKYNFFSQHSS